MKALTIWQPWASLIAYGYKAYEFRGWLPPKHMWGTRIAIHASARKPKLKEIRAAYDEAESAWQTGIYRGRHGAGEAMQSYLNEKKIQPYMLKLTKDGHPYHPLYLKKDLDPIPWE